MKKVKIDLIPYIETELDQQIADGKTVLHLKQPLLDAYEQWLAPHIRFQKSSATPPQMLYYKGHVVVLDDPNEGQAGFTQLSYRGIPIITSPGVPLGTMYYVPRRQGKLTGLTKHK